MEMEKNSTLKYGIWLTGASMMFVSAWFCVRLTGTVGEMGRYLDSMDSVVCMEELLDYEKEENRAAHGGKRSGRADAAGEDAGTGG